MERYLFYNNKFFYSDNIQEIISKPNTLAADDVPNQLPVTSQSLPNEGSVFIKDENVVFNSVAVGEISEQKFRLCNDSKEIQKVHCWFSRCFFIISATKS